MYAAQFFLYQECNEDLVVVNVVYISTVGL